MGGGAPVARGRPQGKTAAVRSPRSLYMGMGAEGRWGDPHSVCHKTQGACLKNWSEGGSVSQNREHWRRSKWERIKETEGAARQVGGKQDLGMEGIKRCDAGAPGWFSL